MKPGRNSKNLEELISQAIGRETPGFEFDKWKQSHKEEIRAFESQISGENISRNVRIFEIGRAIMKSRITRSFAAATVIIGAMIGISYLGDSSEFNQAAWGQMLESMRKMSWMHASKKIDPPMLYDAIERWICFDPSIKIYIYGDGKIAYSDYSKGEAYNYEPEDKTITISPVTEKYNVPGPKSPFDIVSEFFEMKDELGAEINHKHSTIDGKEVEIIESRYVTSLGQCHTQMIRDVDRNLLRSSQTTILRPDTNEEITTVTSYDYPESGPRDIYEAGAPKDAEVVDLRLPEDVQRLLNEVQGRYDRGYGNCVAMILQSWVDEDGTQEPWSIIMFRQQGDLHRMDRYTAGDFKHLVSLYDEIKDDWPDLTIQKVQQLERNEAASRQVIYDGAYTTNRFRVSRNEVKSNRRKGMMRLDYGDSINSLSWFEPPIYGSNRFRVECELLESDPEHVGLIGVHITRLPTNVARNGAGPSWSELVKNDPAWAIFDVSRYWLDPSKDYLVIEQTEIRSGRRTTNVTLETRQTPSGQWYPSHIRHEYTRPLPGGQQQVNRIDKRVVLDIEPVFPEGMFQADYIFNAQ